MSLQARKAESFAPPASGEDDTLEAYLEPYGVGIDAHSKFIQVCILIRDWAGLQDAGS